MPEIHPATMVNRSIRKVLPRSLLGRSLLMILLPLVLLQAVALQIFYGSHLDVVSRRLSSAVGGEVAYTLEMLRRYPEPADRAWILSKADSEFDLHMTIEPGAVLPDAPQDQHPGPDGRRPRHLAAREGRHAVRRRLAVRQPQRADPRAASGRRAERHRAAQAALRRHDLHLRAVDRRHGDAAVRHRRAVHAQSGARDPAPRERCRGVRHGTRYRTDPAGGRHRGAAGGDRVQSDAGARAPLPGAADRDAGRRLARPAHAADPAASGAGDAAGARRTASGRRGDDRRCRRDGADGQRLSGVRARRGDRAGRAGEPVRGAGGGRRRRPPLRGGGGGGRCPRR